MSNVLIGIIGVILFIGLALAGALFLGPRFQESRLKSEAAAHAAMVSQIAHAMNLYRVNEGSTPTAQLANLQAAMDAGYAKGIVAGAGVGGMGVFPLDATGNISSTNPMVTIVRRVGPVSDDKAKAVCAIIDRDAGRTTQGQTFNDSPRTFKTELNGGTPDLLEGTSGCQSNGVNYIAFTRI